MITQEKENNQTLMISAQKGNKKDYQELLNNISLIANFFLKKRHIDSSDIDDIIQDTLMAVHRSRHTYRPELDFDKWMYAIIRYKMADYFKLKGKFKAHFSDVPLDNFESGLKDFSQLKHELSEFMNKLPTHEQQIIQWAKIDGYSIKEISAFINKAESATKVMVHRIMSKLKQFQFGILVVLIHIIYVSWRPI